MGRFWEGTSLLHAMRGEWFDSISCLATFTVPGKDKNPHEVSNFRHTLLRLMSLCHGSALDELKFASKETYEVLDIRGLNDETIHILTHCKDYGFNRVEVVLHMIQVLVIDAQKNNIISVPAPILSRVYQTLSRGFVNLLNARKIKDTRFPFPYAQAINLLMIILVVFTPLTMSAIIAQKSWSAVATFVPVLALYAMNFTAIELEMPFGEDPNDLPLSHFQEEMNTSLLMLIHPMSDHVAKVSRTRAYMDYESLFGSVHDRRNNIARFWIGDEQDLTMRKSIFESACLSGDDEDCDSHFSERCGQHKDTFDDARSDVDFDIGEESTVPGETTTTSSPDTTPQCQRPELFQQATAPEEHPPEPATHVGRQEAADNETLASGPADFDAPSAATSIGGGHQDIQSFAHMQQNHISNTGTATTVGTGGPTSCKPYRSANNYLVSEQRESGHARPKDQHIIEMSRPGHSSWRRQQLETPSPEVPMQHSSDQIPQLKLRLGDTPDFPSGEQPPVFSEL
eukprot:CAMPEP_0172826358 /NCGR_PEP_ID=MMETSP1075-20121228/19360_1 /TAXON_ID=2916 /ORGANISM="Ceratium fusus, Strain PA161109" /LENGTH=511 /DNA_ID=CAMNT_0013668001 /DNA_START=236 /DNA_END=1771 /DNA_ORIENTATION=+